MSAELSTATADQSSLQNSGDRRKTLPAKPELPTPQGRSPSESGWRYWVPQAIQSAMLTVIIVQGAFLADTLTATKDQLKLAQVSASMALYRQLREDTVKLETSLFTNPGLLEKRLNPDLLDCDTPYSPPTAVRLAIKELVSHYELYFDAYKLGLMPKERLLAACVSVLKLRESNCHLHKQWDALAGDFANAAFVETFKSCKLP